MSNPLTVLTLAQLRRRTSEKWCRYPQDVLPVWVAEMDVVLAEPVVAAVTDALCRGDTGYSAGEHYQDALIAFAEQRWDWSPDPAAMRLVPDVMLGIVEVLKLVTRPGDAVIINPPVYPPFYAFLEHAGRRVVAAPLAADHRLDLAALEQAFVTARADGAPAAFLLCNPQNPTGTVHTAEELAAVAELASAHGVRVVADEIHAPLVLPPARHVPYLSLAGSEAGFALLSASKGWNLAGLKAALAVAGPDAAPDLARMPAEVRDGVSHVAVIAHTAALRDGGPWLDAVLGQLDDNRRLLAELLTEHLPVIRYRPPDGTYLAWLDCRDMPLGDDPAGVFLERGRVALSSGPLFGSGGAGHARLNLATSPALIAEAVRRMAAAVTA